MQEYKFTTKISDRGMISLSNYPELFNKEVELLIIMLNTHSRRTQTAKAKAFIDNWAGVFKTDEENDIKYEYLMEKYR